ncbi:MAG: glycosyltransferase [Clostridia bacterium]|nr:glycosyltransferase [Clostridia bacterium]
MNVEVLAVTMGQQDLSLHRTMNVHRPHVIANQCGQWGYLEEEHDYGAARMVSSATKGVGVNRNLTLTLAREDILLFADDDMVYYDAELQGVIDAFESLPDADVILFGIDMVKNGEVFERRRHPVKKLHLWNALGFGGCRMAIRRRAVLKHNLHFTTLFGGGTLYGSGEDSLFLRDCFRAGLTVYSHSYVLGACGKDSSTWFSGFNEKYVFDKGAWLQAAFPQERHLLQFYFIRRFAAKSGFSKAKTKAYLHAGMKAYRTLQPFDPTAEIYKEKG